MYKKNWPKLTKETMFPGDDRLILERLIPLVRSIFDETGSVFSYVTFINGV
jgi:hypothetical protein